MTFAELREALEVFGLAERATLAQIKARHREMVRRYHPDTGNDRDAEMIRKVNEAYRVLWEYVSGYRFSFAEEEFYEQNPEAQLWRQFFDDPPGGRKR